MTTRFDWIVKFLRHTERGAIFLMVCAASLTVACCQADGPVPVKTAEIDNRVGDIARGLMGGGRDGPIEEWLVDDLQVFVDSPAGAQRQAIRDLAVSTSLVLHGSMLSADDARAIAEDLWRAVSFTQASDRQIAGVPSDAVRHLAAARISDDAALHVIADIGDAPPFRTGNTGGTSCDSHLGSI